MDFCAAVRLHRNDASSHERAEQLRVRLGALEATGAPPHARPPLAEVRKRIARAGSNGLNEPNTKSTLIESVLRALGWDVEDVDEVAQEYRGRPKDKPVD